MKSFEVPMLVVCRSARQQVVRWQFIVESEARTSVRVRGPRMADLTDVSRASLVHSVVVGSMMMH